MTGWRVGYTAAPAPLIQAMTALQSQSTSNPTSIAQAAASAALTGPQECVRAMATEFLARRDLVVERLRQIPGVRTTKPEGAFYVFPDFSAFFGKRGPDGEVASAGDLGAYLLRHASVATVPGEGFGAPRHIRLSYAAKREVLEEGIARIRDALAGLAWAARATNKKGDGSSPSPSLNRRQRIRGALLFASPALFGHRSATSTSCFRPGDACLRTARGVFRPRRRGLGSLRRLPDLAHRLTTCPEHAEEHQDPHTRKCLLHAHHLLLNVCGR